MTGEDATMGLWSVCVKDECRSFTKETMNSPERFSRIAVVLSCMAGFSSVCLSVYGLCSSKSRGIFACVTAMFSSFCMLTTLLLYTLEENATKLLPVPKKPDLSYGSTYILGWVSVSLSVLSFICFFSLFYASVKLET